MHLHELLAHSAQRPATSVPDWMLGFYKRHSISFANGLSDLNTHVCWLQSRNFTIDLRLPQEDQQAPAKALADYSAAELQTLANYEGWEALSVWDGETLSWHTDSSLQLNNRWPEPALLQRIGNCMIELAPSGAYVEDWRLQPSAPGPLIGLRMLHERNLETGEVRHRGGGLIICGDYAALVLGRAEPIVAASAEASLPALVAEATGDARQLQRLFNFETSLAQGSLTKGFCVQLSTQPQRIHQPLLALDGFALLADGRLRQQLTSNGVACERLYAIDTLEADLPFAQATSFTADAARWFERESPTLTRYAAQLI